MATKDQLKKAKRKARLQNLQKKRQTAIKKEHAEFFAVEADFYLRLGELDKALACAEKGLGKNPDHADLLEMLAYAASKADKPALERKALWGLHIQGLLEDDKQLRLCDLLIKGEKFRKAIDLMDEILGRFETIRYPQKTQLKKRLLQNKAYCESRLWWEAQAERRKEKSRSSVPAPQGQPQAEKPAVPGGPDAASVPGAAPAPSPSLPEIKVSVELDAHGLETALAAGAFADAEAYGLAIEGHRLRFRESFEDLVCLAGLSDVRSLWYQEETAKKVLKSFRGRALLADEVGLGKTVEALIVLKEYIQRGMVKSGLILTPTALVSQWREELRTKFALEIPSTDDPDFRSCGDAFWQEPFVLASINVAKSKKNFSQVTGREYDLVIVDEAHHLKSRTTLNWKLVNALKKRFLLMLTATPVENNLMELYNLITLLKPGQLKTAAAFKQEFMTRGDPTDPQNRQKLRELLGQVMIRNTRAVAKLDIPPRFAQTIRLEPSAAEKDLYDRMSALVREINAGGNGHSRLLLKNLLATAGSSPRAVELTLRKMLESRDLLLAQEKEAEAIRTLCRGLDSSRKNEALLEIVRSTPDKLLVFVKFMGTLSYISDFLDWHHVPHALFHGGLSNREKDEQIRMFEEEKSILIATEVGGEGRNLQFCHRMVNYDLPWNPMKIEQRIGRIHRLGQEKEVTIYNLCAAGSLEDYILDVLDRKINMFELVIGEIDMILGRVRGEQEFSDLVYDLWLTATSEEERGRLFGKLAGQLQRSRAGYEKTKALDEKLFGESYEL